MATDESLLLEHRQAEELAAEVLGMDLFSRMVFAANLAKKETGLKPFLRGLTQLVKASARKAEAAAGTRLEALERFHRHLAANVNLKVALEGLMLEL